MSVMWRRGHGVRDRRRETGSAGTGASFHPKHLGHIHGGSGRWSRSAGAGEGGEQGASDPVYWSNVSNV